LRKFIKTEKLNGKLVINNEHTFENVYGEYQYDVYSNRDMRGSLNLNNLFSHLKSIDELDEFQFYGNGLKIEGEILSWTFGGNDVIDFNIYELIERVKYSSEQPKEICIKYYIPYIKVLARSLRSGFPDDNYILKFNSEEFKLDLQNIPINFFEIINFVNHNDPDKLLNRLLYPQIKIGISNLENIYELLNKYECLFEDVMRIISLLFFKRLNSFGYIAEILSDNGKIVQSIKYKNTRKQSCDDYLKDTGYNFKKDFTPENVSKLISAFLNLETTKKEKFIRIINAYITIDDLKIFEPQFKDAFFALEAISKLIVEPKNNLSSENYIVKACNIAEIDLIKVSFEPSKNSKKLKWLISEYRNELTHFNFETHYDNDQMYMEYSKIMNILRRLIIYYLVPDLNNFSYPRDKYRI